MRARAVLAALLLWPALACAKITLVDADSADGGTNTRTTASITRPGGAAVGNLLVVQLALRSAATITAPAGWTLLRRDTSGTTLSSAIYYRFYASGDSATISFTLGTASRYAIGILAYSGVDTANPIDDDAGRTNTSSTTLTAPSITETYHNDQEIWFYAHARSGNINTPASAGATQYRDVSTNGTATNNVAIMAADRAQTTAATTGNQTATHGNAAVNIGQAIALRPLIRLRAEYLMEEASWNGTAGEVDDTSGNGFDGASVAGAATAVSTPALGTNPGTCRYGSFAGGTTASRLNMGAAQIGIGGGTGVTAMAWARWAITPSSGNNWGALVTNQSTATADVGQIWLEESQNNANWEFAVSTTTSRQYVFSTAVPTANTWTHVAGVFDGSQIRIYVNGVLSGTQAHTGTVTADNAAYVLNVGSWAYNSSNYRSFQGLIDEVRVYDGALNAAQIDTAMNTTRACILIDHYRVQNNAAGINCQAETVVITAHTASHVPTPAGGQVITIAANRTAGAAGNHGDWSLVSGGGTLNNGTADDGIATYTFAAGEASVTLAYKNTWVQTVNFGVTDGIASDTGGAANGDAAYNQDLAFASSGFRFINASNGSIPTQTAGTSGGPYSLQAIQTGTGGCTSGSCTGACTVPAAFGNGATASVELAFRCDNPTTCQAGQQVSIVNNGTTAIAANPASGVTAYTTKSLLFGSNGQAQFSLTYPDVGAISLFARYNIPLGTGAGSGNYMTGSSNSFVVKPAGFVVSNTPPNQVKRTSDGFVNPAAAGAGGTAFIRAGENFTATVTAVNSSGNATPNYGKEISPETVKLTANLAGGLGLTNNPALANATAFGAFSGGSATGTTFNWGEVGIITLTPSVGDADYLGTGDVTGTASGNVGRFIPYDFAVTRNTPSFAPACASGLFTYVGQPFLYATVPVIGVTARNKAGGTTQNYKGAFWKVTAASLTGKTYVALSGTLDVTGLPSPDPAIGYNGDGVSVPQPAAGTGTLTFDSGTGLKFTRDPATPSAPFNAELGLAISVADTDATTVASIDAAAAANPVRFGTATAGNGIAFTGAGKEMRYGRMRLNNAYGSTLLDLPLGLSVESYAGAGGFALNTADSCTTLAGSDL
ncbi:MAG TPA: LamG domain-containing protein, partial [Burkholderiales bacterium]|nr:LamG domain-containing protein [Burkholderiales bacterium]